MLRVINLKELAAACLSSWAVMGVTSGAGQHLHQLIRHTSLSHTVNQSLDVPETIDSSKLQKCFTIPL